MNAVDHANQLRKNLTINRPLEYRIWHPLWNFCVDIIAVNSYICWRYGKPARLRQQRKFREELINALLCYPLECEAYSTTPRCVDGWPGHNWIKFDKRGYCEWCTGHPRDNIRRRRKVLGEIRNEATLGYRIRPGQTRGGCQKCNAWLCSLGNCFRKFHSFKDRNSA